MTQEEKQLLLADLCARLPYGVIINIPHIYPHEFKAYLKAVNPEREIIYYEICDSSSPLFDRNILGAKPYLRPMSSMTDEEKSKMLTIFERPCKNPKLEVDEYYGIRYTKYAEDHRIIDMYYDSEQQAEWLDWLNAHHFDFRGLIPRGLALEAPEDMYKF